MISQQKNIHVGILSKSPNRDALKRLFGITWLSRHSLILNLGLPYSHFDVTPTLDYPPSHVAME